MKKTLFRFPYFILIIPLFTLILSFLFRFASGPFWQYADPSYIYLFNAFQIIKGHPPTDISHPGTPLQLLIAFIIRILNLGQSPAAAVDHVLVNPEYYLRAVYAFLVFSSFLTSVILGNYIYRQTKDVLAVFLVQLTGLFFILLPSFNSGTFPVLPVIANVSPEPLFISIMNLFSLFLLKLYFSDKKSGDLRHILLLAFVCGLGLATKLNFLFVLISALMLVPIRKKILFILVFVLSFVFFTLPIVAKYPQLFSWIGNMIGHSGRYGMGDEKLIDWNSFFLFFKLMLRFYWFYIYAALGLWAWSSVSLLINHKNRNARFIWGLTFCALLHFLATAKYFSFHYLLPGFGLFGPIFLLFYLSQRSRYKFMGQFTAAFILIFISVCLFYSIPYYKKLMILSQDIRQFDDRLKAKYPDCALIPSTTVDTNFFLDQQAGLHKGNATTFRLENEDLFRLYPHSYYFFSEEVTSPETNVESYGIWNFKQRVTGDDVLSDCPCAIFVKFVSDFSPYPYQTVTVDKSRYLNAFLMVHSTEREADELFARAMEAYKKGDYQQAFVLGLRSRQLNYEPRGQIEYILTGLYRQLFKSQDLK